METRLSTLALQNIFSKCWVFLKVNFISLVNSPCEEAYSEPSQTYWIELSAYIDNDASPWIMFAENAT